MGDGVVLSVAVFCGARRGNDPHHLAAAERLGRGLAEAGMRLVYGGGRVGLMGAVADAALAADGDVLGIIPEFLRTREIAHGQVDQLIVTDSMHSRKNRMFELADAFVSIAGGLGTLDETIEIITWRQLGLHDKPILLCNEGGWARGFLAALQTAVADGFAGPDTFDLLEVLPDVPAVLARLREMHPAGISVQPSPA